MSALESRSVRVGDLDLHLTEAGTGPLVLLLHGFPELGYSWRHQLPALAQAGFHAVAPDQRGYGSSGRPDNVGAYSILHLVGDVIGLLDALGARRAVVVGHDWGAQVAWFTALLRPDRVAGVAGLSVPYQPRGSGGILSGGDTPPLARIRSTVGDTFFLSYFQRPGVADADLGRSPRTTMRRLLYSAGGDAACWQLQVPPGGDFLDTVREPDRLPEWLTEADLDVYESSFHRTGFTGGLNWYRNLDRNWELTAAWHLAPVPVPALFLVGDRDPTVTVPGGEALLAAQQTWLPQLQQLVVLPGCGHWTQQERPEEVSRTLVDFATTLTHTESRGVPDDAHLQHSALRADTTFSG